MSPYSKYLCNCSSCGSSTTKKYARANNGLCKGCNTGVYTEKRSSSFRNRKQFGGHCEDAPCCGCCGPQAEPEKYYSGYGSDY